MAITFHKKAIDAAMKTVGDASYTGTKGDAENELESVRIHKFY